MLDETDYSAHKRLCQIVIPSKVRNDLNVLMNIIFISVALGDRLLSAQTAVPDCGMLKSQLGPNCTKENDYEAYFLLFLLL